MYKSRNATHLKGVIERIKIITNDCIEADLPDYARDRLAGEIDFHEKTLAAGFEDRKRTGPEITAADSDAYFGEKLAGLSIFARMAVKPDEREGYGPEKIKENVDHYAYLVSGLVAAD